MRNTIAHGSLLATLLMAAPALAQQSQTRVYTATGSSGQNAQSGATATAQTPGTMTIVSSESLDGGDPVAGGQTFEIRVDNDNVSIKQNGQEIPASRIKRENGRIIVLDENGNEMKSINLGLFAGPGGYFYRAGDADAQNGATLYPRMLNAAGGLRGMAVRENGDAGESPKVMIGVHMGEPGPALEKHLHLNAGKSTMITGLFEGLPADQAGIGEFDIIVAVDGSESGDADTVRKILQGKGPGDTVTLRVIQAGTAKDIKIKLDAYDAEKMKTAKLIGRTPDGTLWRGGDIAPLDQLYGGLKDWDIQLPEGMDRQLWISPRDGIDFKGQLPNWDQFNVEALKPEQWQQLQPMIQQQLRDALKQYHIEAAPQSNPLGGGGPGRDVEKQLDRLDERLSQLESLLQKLIDKQAKP